MFQLIVRAIRPDGDTSGGRQHQFNSFGASGLYIAINAVGVSCEVP